jgi:hypothetical protein
VRMMEECRRSQEATERASAVMDKLLGMLVMGRSVASLSGGGGDPGNCGGWPNEGRGQGYVQRPSAPRGGQGQFEVLVPPIAHVAIQCRRWRWGCCARLAGCGGGVISAEELNNAIADEMRDGYKRSGRVMEDKLRRLYKQLGLSRDPAPLPSNKLQE